MSWLRFALGQWRLVTSALVAGAIIHILVTIVWADFNQSSAYRVLTRDLPTNEVVFAKPITAEAQPLPFMHPDALYAYCAYDASTTQVRLTATLHGPGWSLSLHTPQGENFYYVPGSTDRVTNIQLVLQPPGNVFTSRRLEIDANSKVIPVVRVPRTRGVAILRAPVKGLAYRRLIDEQRSQFKCNAASGRR